MPELLEKPLPVSENHFLLKIKSDCPKPQPGQFVSIKAGKNLDPLLRRPFSIFNYHDKILELIVQRIGKGTDLIVNTEPGPIDIIGPFGNGFTIEEGGNVLIVGGGVGNAPLFYLSEELRQRGCSITYIYCSRSSRYVYCEDKYRDSSLSFHLMTDDGSAGTRGFATEIMPDILNKQKFKRIYTCGPTPMMRAVTQSAEDFAPVEVSLENYFGCGFGICSGCTVETKSGQKRACKDGPVIDGSQLIWDSLT